MVSPLPKYEMPVQQMAKAIMARLRLAFPADRFQIDRIPPQMTYSEYEKRFLKQSPFMGLSFEGAKFAEYSGRRLQGAYKWSLACALKATGDFNRRFEGDTRDIGLDMMTDAAVAVLHAANFKGIGSVAVSGIACRYTPDWGDAAAVLANIDFEIMTTLEYGDLQLDELPEFFGITGNLTVNGEAE